MYVAVALMRYLFQFHIVQLKAYGPTLGLFGEYAFQFHIVQLKEAITYARNNHPNDISIPYSTIKSELSTIKARLTAEFQFHIVQLKGLY